MVKDNHRIKITSCLTVTFFTVMIYILSHVSEGLSSLIPLYWLLGIPVIYYYKQKTPFTIALTQNKPLLSQFYVGIALCLCTILLASFLNIFYSLYLNMTYLESLRNYGPSGQNIIYALFIIGFGEEWFFRGFIFDKLYKDTQNKLITILLSSLLFGLMHFRIELMGAYHWALIGNMIFCVLIGLLYSSARFYIKNCTLVSVSLAHGLYWIVMPLIVQHV